MRKLILVLAFVLTAALAQAQPAVTSDQEFFWSHTGDRVEFFKLVIDGQPVLDVAGGALARSVDIPALTPGQHTWRIDSCNAAGCAPSATQTFTLLAVPEPATGLGIRSKAQ
jgi:hypothetical protein